MTAKMAIVTCLGVFMLVPSSLGHLRFIQLTTPLSISAEKSHPPFLAFHESERLRLKDPWDQMDEQEALPLVAEAKAPAPLTRLVLAQETFVFLEPERFTEQERKTASLDWAQQLPPQQKVRVLEAQRKFGELGAEPPASPALAPTLADLLQQRLQTQGALADQPLRIEGEFKLLDLALLNDTTLEIRRRHEGIYEETGEVQPLAATYGIQVKGRTGEVVVRLRDRNQRILGESSFRLSSLQGAAGESVTGPRLVIQPKSDFAGRVLPAYANNQRITRNKAIPGLKGEALLGAASLDVTRNGDYELNNIRKGSFSTLSVEATDHARTNVLSAAGSRADLPLFPTSMIASLKELVSEERREGLVSKDASVVWGRVQLDGKPLSGVQVSVESAPDVEPVYFNEWLLPDPKLTGTSANGIYAFVGVPSGFHAVLAERDQKYFAHRNVVVEDAAVAVGDLESSVRAESAPLRVFDAFTGETKPATVVHQGVPEPIEVSSQGLAFVSLPSFHRLSLSQVNPEAPYSPARYYSDDERGYVHFPLIREDWIRYLKASAHVSDMPGTATVVGFVPHEDFEAEVLDPEGQVKRVYFDSLGRPVERGVMGGGFVLFGVSEGVRDVIVTSLKTGELATQTVAADPQSLTVLRFQED